MISSSKLWKDCRGIAAVEFALISPMLFLLTIGIIDVGRMMWTASTIDHAAREGARFAMVRGAGSLHPTSQEEIASFVIDRAVGVKKSKLNISVNWSPNNYKGSVVTITVVYQYDSLLAGLIGLESIDFKGSSSLPVS